MGRVFLTTADQVKHSLKELYAKRDAVSQDMEQAFESIPTSVGMNGPLLDNDGYPRADVDVMHVRMQRQKIISELQYHPSPISRLGSTICHTTTTAKQQQVGSR